MATGTRKRTSSKRTTTKRITKKKQQEQASFRNEVILWVTLAICIILFIANLGVGGFVGGKLSSFVFGIFGLIAYVFPICLFVGAVFTISNKENRVATIKLIAGILFVSFLCLFVQMVSNSSDVQTPMEAFRDSMETKAGGGIIGGALANLLCPNFGTIGTYVIDIIVLIISLVLITEKSAFSGMQKGGKVLYDSAKEDMVRRKDINEQRKEDRAIERENREREKEKKRMEMKVSGVALDTKILPQQELGANDASDEINEITLDDILQMPTVNEEEHIRLTSDSLENEKVSVSPSNAPSARKTTVRPIVPEQLKPEFEPDFESEFEPDFEADIELAMEQQIEPETPKKVTPKKSPSVAETKHSNEIIMQTSMDVQNIAGSSYVFPPVSLLKQGNKNASGDSKRHTQETAIKLQQTLKNFGVNVTITNVSCGPAVTRYELQPEMGVKVSKIVNLADDIKLNLAAADIRIEAPIPGKAAIGIEVPNKESAVVMFRELVESDDFVNHKSPIAFAAGKDIGGRVIVTDIAKMPHLLIAGATGSGKSVCINTIIMSIIYRAHPDDVKLIMIDPKVVELSVYNGIPHLFIPVVTDPKKAAGALHWAVAEMTDRYQKFADYGVRDLKGYNQKVDAIKAIDDPDKPKKMPQIVIIVDELADLMMVAPGDVEDAICRLAQLARAAGIHLIIATQRPSVNVITGLIKANMPSRIAFSVTSGIDSRTILDMNGAEKLLGKGDMLFYPQGMPKPLRVQGAFVTDKEVSDVVDFMKNQNGAVTYSEEIEEKMSSISTGSSGADLSSASGDDRDVYFVDAAKLLMDKDKGSIGMLQRYFKIGFNRAARIMDQLEEAGVVGPDEGTKPRQILMSPEQLEVYIDENC
jgi:S-DNA-T family DNA segregation ATPase FtsK/SpoIIIE